MQAIIVKNATPEEIAALASAVQERQTEEIHFELDGKAIAQAVSEAIGGMLGGHED